MYVPVNSISWSSFFGGSSEEEIEQPVSIPPPQLPPQNVRHYPIWRVHKYKGMDLRPIPVSLVPKPHNFQSQGSIRFPEPNQYYQGYPQNNPVRQQVQIPQLPQQYPIPQLPKQHQIPPQQIPAVPEELIELAKKLGVNDLSKLPSIDDIMNVLGTTSRTDTIEAINELASTPEGLDLIKSYLATDDNDAESSEQKSFFGGPSSLDTLPHESYELPPQPQLPHENYGIPPQIIQTTQPPQPIPTQPIPTQPILVQPLPTLPPQPITSEPTTTAPIIGFHQKFFAHDGVPITEPSFGVLSKITSFPQKLLAQTGIPQAYERVKTDGGILSNVFHSSAPNPDFQTTVNRWKSFIRLTPDIPEQKIIPVNEIITSASTTTEEPISYVYSKSIELPNLPELPKLPIIQGLENVPQIPQIPRVHLPNQFNVPHQSLQGTYTRVRYPLNGFNPLPELPNQNYNQFGLSSDEVEIISGKSKVSMAHQNNEESFIPQFEKLPLDNYDVFRNAPQIVTSYGTPTLPFDYSGKEQVKTVEDQK